MMWNYTASAQLTERQEAIRGANLTWFAFSKSSIFRLPGSNVSIQFFQKYILFRKKDVIFPTLKQFELCTIKNCSKILKNVSSRRGVTLFARFNYWNNRQHERENIKRYLERKYLAWILSWTNSVSFSFDRLKIYRIFRPFTQRVLRSFILFQDEKFLTIRFQFDLAKKFVDVCLKNPS